jgi:hypothetical protein
LFLVLSFVLSFSSTLLNFDGIILCACVRGAWEVGGMHQ